MTQCLYRKKGMQGNSLARLIKDLVLSLLDWTSLDLSTQSSHSATYLTHSVMIHLHSVRTPLPKHHIPHILLITGCPLDYYSCLYTLTLAYPVSSWDSLRGLRDVELQSHEAHSYAGTVLLNCRGLIWQLMIRFHSSFLWGNNWPDWEKHNDHIKLLYIHIIL